MKKLAIGIGLLALLALAVPALSQGPALPPGQYDLEEGQYMFNVPALAATDTPVAPTDTPVPPPTATPVPSGDRSWHPLTEALGHDHGDNPHLVDDIFGTQFYVNAGGELSYPWETPNENATKHEGNKWFVGRDLDPSSSSSSEVFISAYRVHAHILNMNVLVTGSSQPRPEGESGTGGGATTRVHSLWSEFQICLKSDPSMCMLWGTGRWADYGPLKASGVHVPLAQDTCAPDGAGGCLALPDVSLDGGRGTRAHGACEGDFQRFAGGTYWRTDGRQHPDEYFFKIVFQMNDTWGCMDRGNPFVMHFTCPDIKTCGKSPSRNNGSVRQIFRLDLEIVQDFDGTNDGVVNFSGHTDRLGNIQPDVVCSSPSVDCIPFYVQNGFVGLRLKAHSPTGPQEYDISPDGEDWIEYPN